MKIREGYQLTSSNGDNIVSVKTGYEADLLHGIVILNSVGKDAWLILENGCSYEELIKKLLTMYNVSEDILRKDVNSFLDKISFALVEE